MDGSLGHMARRRGWFVSKAERARGAAGMQEARREPNVVLLSGGSLHVPDSDWKDFLQAYARDVELGVRHYVVERAGERHKWYCDIDLVPASGREPCDEEVLRIAEIASSLLSSSLVVALVSRSEAKTGIHLIGPWVKTTPVECMQLREELVRALDADERLAGMPSDAEGWCSSVDEAVYKNGSLRMVGSRKMQFQKKEAEGGGGGGEKRGKVDVGRTYVYLGCAGKESVAISSVAAQNFAQLVRLTSVRVIGGERRKEAGGRTGGETGIGSGARPRLNASSSSRKHGHPSSCPFPSLPSAPLSLSSLVSDPSQLHERHRGLAFTVSRWTPTCCWLKVEEEEEGSHGGSRTCCSRYCECVSRSHSSSRVWFVATFSSLQQRCHCRKGACSDYRGRRIPLSYEGRRRIGLCSREGLPYPYLTQSLGRSAQF